MYDIRISNPDGVSRGIASITVDGEPITGDTLPVAEAGQTCRVDVIMGAA